MRVVSDQYGSFVIRGVAPGRYSALAVDRLEAHREQSPAFLRENKSRATAAELKDDDRRTIELKIVRSEGT